MRELNLNLGRIAPFETRTWLEKRYVRSTFQRPFSGFLGGIHKGGYWVERLAEEWQSTFRVQHAIPCNSATSGLLAACMAIAVKSGDIVWAPVYTMSATAACAKVLGAKVRFLDIEDDYFCIDYKKPLAEKPYAVIVTNLFGHPAQLESIRSWCDENSVWMIEDNAQAPFAKEDGIYAGTVGHLGVFSLNIHKHMQTGEGGVVVTDDHTLALAVKDATNHGELRQGGITGLNLRMTEPIAALAVAQLNKGPTIIEGRRELAQEMTDMVKDFRYIVPPKERDGCQHVYYIWASKLKDTDRNIFVQRLNECGFPMNAGYSPLLSEVFKTMTHCPAACELEAKELITFDICSYSPNKKQRSMMREIFKIVGESFR